MANLTLQDLKTEIDKIKSDLAKKEGERSAVATELERDFGMQDLDAAYKELDKLEEEIASKKKTRNTLEQEIGEKLAKYGY